jgi:archaellum component FlaC
MDIQTNNIISFEYDFEESFNLDDIKKKQICTFTTEEELENTIQSIKDKYSIVFNKIFVLFSKSQDEYMCTYNVDEANVSTFLENTILVHRKKESNTLYTINALNELIKELNDGELDTSFRVNWNDYRNCILLTKGAELKRINTKLHEIVEF